MTNVVACGREKAGKRAAASNGRTARTLRKTAISRLPWLSNRNRRSGWAVDARLDRRGYRQDERQREAAVTAGEHAARASIKRSLSRASSTPPLSSSCRRTARHAATPIFRLTPQGEAGRRSHQRGGGARHRSARRANAAALLPSGTWSRRSRPTALTKRYGGTVAVDDLSIGAARPGDRLRRPRTARARRRPCSFSSASRAGCGRGASSPGRRYADDRTAR